MSARAERVLAASAAELASLHARCFTTGWAQGEIASLLNLPGCVGWAVRSGSQFMAMALFRQAADEAELLTLATDPEFRRLGMADMILTSGESFLLGQGVARVFLEVSEYNAGAQGLYQRTGYAQIARRRAYYRDGSDALVLEKWLHRDGQTAP